MAESENASAARGGVGWGGGKGKRVDDIRIVQESLRSAIIPLKIMRTAQNLRETEDFVLLMAPRRRFERPTLRLGVKLSASYRMVRGVLKYRKILENQHF